MAGLVLLLVACGGTANPDPNDPGGGDPGPVTCRETLSGDILTSLHLQNFGDGCDYLVTGNNLNVDARLSAEPGVLVMVAAGSRIMVGEGGSIKLEGTATSPVTFAGSVQEPGSWDGFCFGVGHEESRFSHVHVVWAGNRALPTSSNQCRGAIGSIGDYAPVSITDSVVFGSATTGIEAARMKLSSFSNNRLAHNAEYGIRVSGENVGKLDTATDYAGEVSVLPDGSITPNGIPYVYVVPGTSGVATPGEHTWRNLGVPFHVASDSPHYTTSVLNFHPDTLVAVEAGTTLLIGEHVSLNIDDGAVLGLFGTEGAPVTVTADSAGAVPGHWDGIRVNGGGLIAIDAQISYGGQASGISRLRGNVGFFSSSPTYPCSHLENTVLARSGTYGVNIDPSYSDFVSLASSNGYVDNSAADVSGTAAGPAVRTFDEALACM